MIATFALGAFACDKPVQERPLLREAAKLRDLILAGRFDELERIEKETRDLSRVASDGQPLRAAFSVGHMVEWSDSCAARSFDQKALAGYRDLRPKLDAWAKAKPQSLIVPILDADYHESLAWAIRGTRFSSEVEASAWSGFNENIETARKKLDNIQGPARSDALWYASRLDVALVQRMDADKYHRLFIEALRTHPAYFSNYFTGLSYYSPKWGGSRTAFAAAMKEALEVSTFPDKDVLYARMWWAHGDRDMFWRDGADWARMKKGFEAMLTAHPDPWNLNVLGKFACYAQDRQTLRQVLAKIDSKPLASAWGDKEGYDFCVMVAKYEPPEHRAQRAKQGIIDPPPQAAPAVQPPLADGPPYTTRHFNQLRFTVDGAFTSGDVALIERLHAEHVGGQSRTTDGRWMAEAVQEGLDSPLQAWPAADSERWLKQWQAKIPDSKLAPVVAAMRWQALAWQVRSGRIPANTNAEAMQIFYEHMERAAKALNDSAGAGKQSPLWYWTALIVAGSTGMPTPAFDALFEEAVARYPTYQTLYFTRANYLLPQWGGDYQRVEAFVRKSVQRTAATEGESFYARIYVDLQQKIRDDYLEVSAATWPRMKKGLEDLVSRYPDDWNKGLYTAMACRARDRETTARLLQQLGDNARFSQWARGINKESCQRFVSGKG